MRRAQKRDDVSKLIYLLMSLLNRLIKIPSAVENSVSRLTPLTQRPLRASNKNTEQQYMDTIFMSKLDGINVQVSYSHNDE